MVETEQLKARVAEIRTENDKLNERLAALTQERDRLVQQALVNNGRILELERLLQDQ